MGGGADLAWLGRYRRLSKDYEYLTSTFAGELNRAEAARILLDAGLVNAEQVDPGSTHGNRR